MLRRVAHTIEERPTRTPEGNVVAFRRAGVVRSHSFCALSHRSCAQNPTVCEPSYRCPLCLCETPRPQRTGRTDRRTRSGILCRVAHALWDVWLTNSGMCATVHTQTWLKNSGILHSHPSTRYQCQVRTLDVFRSRTLTFRAAGRVKPAHLL